MSAQPETQFALKLDLTGLKCPLPVLKTRRALQDMQRGDLLRVCTTDPMSEIDIPHLAADMQAELLSLERVDRVLFFLIRR